MKLTLISIEGAHRIEIEKNTIVGRHYSCGLRLPWSNVSRQHCEIKKVNGNWRVHDLKSLNGTFVNNMPVEEVMLCHGDTLTIGSTNFKVVMTADTPSELNLPVLPV